jgi:S-adenosylmethionine hydrolase
MGSELVREEGGALRTRVVYVDRFGNLITSCPGAALPANARIRVGEQVVIEGLCRTFADVSTGELVAYIGSADTLEIAVREDSAASVLELGAGAEVVIEYEHGHAHGHGNGNGNGNGRS